VAVSFKALKPGGILGIEEHRGRNDQPQDPKAKNAMCARTIPSHWPKKRARIRRLLGSGMPNPRDTKDWVDGVWTLPPTLSRARRIELDMPPLAKPITSCSVPKPPLRCSRRDALELDQISGPIRIGEPSLNRDARNGVGSHRRSGPIASSAASRPAAGPIRSHVRESGAT